MTAQVAQGPTSVWYQLCEQNGSDYTLIDGTADEIYVPTAKIIDFKKAVATARTDAKLPFHTNLRVFSSISDGGPTTELSASTVLHGSNYGTAQAPLIVVFQHKAPSPQAAGGNVARVIPEAIISFWKNIQDAKLDGGILTLKSGNYFLGDESFGNQLYIRDCYDKLEARMQEIWYKEKLTGAVLIGNPGIGKSMMGMYLMYKYALEKRKIIVRKFGWQLGEPHLFCSDGVRVLTNEDFNLLCADPGVIYILDALPIMKTGKPLAAKMVLLTSPRRDRYKEAEKSWFIKLVMDVWSFAELKLIQRLHPNLTDEQLLDRFRRWGGVARIVLGPERMDNERELIAAIDNCSVDILDAHSRVNDLKEYDISHKVFHLASDAAAGYELGSISFASPWVREKILAARAWKRERARVLQYIRATEGVTIGASLRGESFEQYCHVLLAEGGTFMIKDLSKPYSQPKLRTFPASSVARMFTRLSEVEQEADGAYLYPCSKTLCAVDAVRQPNDLWQMTVASSHPIVASGLAAAASVLRGTEPILYFAVPEDKFNTFKEQKIIWPKNTQEANTIAPQIKKVVQYALEIKLRQLSLGSKAGKDEESSNGEEGSAAPKDADADSAAVAPAALKANLSLRTETSQPTSSARAARPIPDLANMSAKAKGKLPVGVWDMLAGPDAPVASAAAMASAPAAPAAASAAAAQERGGAAWKESGDSEPPQSNSGKIKRKKSVAEPEKIGAPAEDGDLEPVSISSKRGKRDVKRASAQQMGKPLARAKLNSPPKATAAGAADDSDLEEAKVVSVVPTPQSPLPLSKHAPPPPPLLRPRKSAVASAVEEEKGSGCAEEEEESSPGLDL